MSIGRCQTRASAGRHQQTVPRAHFSTHWRHLYFKFSADILFDHGLNSVFLAELHSLENLSILENLAITWPYTHRLNVHTSHHRNTNVWSHSFLLVWEPAAWYCAPMWPSMLWSIDSEAKQCIRRPVSPERYRGLKYRPTECECFFEIVCWQVTTFLMIAGSSSIFLKMLLK